MQVIELLGSGGGDKEKLPNKGYSHHLEGASAPARRLLRTHPSAASGRGSPAATHVCKSKQSRDNPQNPRHYSTPRYAHQRAQRALTHHGFAE